MITVHADLLTVIEAVEVLSPSRYLFLGETREADPQAAPTPTASANPGGNAMLPEEPAILPMLESELYARLYTRLRHRDIVLADPLAKRDHMAALSAANNGRCSWEPGWTIRALENDGWVTVAKDGITFWTRRRGLRARNGVLREGESCRVRVPKEMRHWLPDYYLAIGDGDQGETADAPEPVVRFYWHLTAHAAVPYMAAVTKTLNARNIPFRTKVLSDPYTYLRADAGVLYVARRYHRRLGNAIPLIYHRIAGDLRPQVPLFTKPLAPGLGLAESPLNGLSFGQHRCRIVALGLWRSYLQGDRTKEPRLATLAAAFREAGLNPESPHLEPGSRDRYWFRPWTAPYPTSKFT